MPEKPKMYQPQFDGNLCLSEDGARQLLKNKAMIDDYIKQLELMIEGLR